MTKSLESFQLAITDAEELMSLFDSTKNANKQPIESLKRAALILILTAWESYIEDVATELFKYRYNGIKGSPAGVYIERQFNTTLKMFNNPTSLKVKHLFEEFFEEDITQQWQWNNYQDPNEVRTILNKWMNKRGEAVHIARTDLAKSHIIKRSELDKCVLFFKGLVNITDEIIGGFYE